MQIVTRTRNAPLTLALMGFAPSKLPSLANKVRRSRLDSAVLVKASSSGPNQADSKGLEQKLSRCSLVNTP